MGQALVLNATYEPLSIVAGRRACVLVLTGKADLVHATNERLRSERLSVQIPSVIKLRYFVRMPFVRGSALSRRGVFARDGQQCQYCGANAESIDHVRPRSRGGEHRWDNVVAACRRCNTKKRDHLLQETSMRLVRLPRQPPTGSWVSMLVPNMPLAWEQYLPPQRFSA